jgi:hypothetical protein
MHLTVCAILNVGQRLSILVVSCKRLVYLCGMVILVRAVLHFNLAEQGQDVADRS